MTRRELLALAPFLTLATVARIAAHPSAGQIDPGFVRLWQAAQVDRPTAIPAHGRIAPADEPGQPLVIHGQLFRENGIDPIPQAIIFAYQTDQHGLYNAPGKSGWRLRGWVQTDDRGHFTFETIRPAPYPSRSEPAHIHLTAEGSTLRRQVLPSLRFADDALLTGVDRATAAQSGRFTNLCTVVTRDDVQSCQMLFRLTGEYVF